MASRLKLLPRDDDSNRGHAVLVELEIAGEKFRRVLVVEEAEA